MSSNRNLLFAVGLVLLINIVLLSRVGDLNNQVESLSRNYSNLQSEIGSLSGNIDQKLDRFTREQSWITQVSVNEGKTNLKDQGGTVALNWQIKDLPEAAEVVFHYSESESGEFKSVPAEGKDAGFFEVSVPLEIEVAPFWDIMVSKTRGLGTATSEQTVVPAEPSVQQVFRYYVSMKIKDTTKSSEVSYLDIAYLAHTKYEPIAGHVDINDNDNRYSISLFEHNPSNNNFKSVLVKFYNGNKKVFEKAMEVRDIENGMKNYNLTYEADSKKISHLVIQVNYQNGKTFEKKFSQ